MENSPLTSWETFYVIVGSSGAALTGLQFVVIALIAESKARATLRQIDAFGTPTIVHFCAALLIAAILTAPWHGLTNVSRALGALGLAGLVYAVIITRRARLQEGYQPVFEDWLWHAILPLIAYALLLVSAFALRASPQRVLFVIGGTTLLLLFIGIHNAWDTVTFIAVGGLQKEVQPRKKRGATKKHAESEK